MGKSFLCMAHGRDGDWEAICLDLDLAVQGRTFDEVQKALNQSVADYIVDALQEDKDTARKLLSRSAPWYVRAKMMLGFFINTAFRRDEEYRHAFNMHCPA